VRFCLPAEPTFHPLQPTFTPEPPTATPEPLALTVNGEGITVVEFDAEVARYMAAQEALGRNGLLERTASAVIEDLTAQLLLAQAARGTVSRSMMPPCRCALMRLPRRSAERRPVTWQSAEHGYSEQTFGPL
jgi:hypothetical protein